MKTSVIRHPAGQPLILIRQWQKDFCDGNITQAALLSFFEHWHNLKLELRESARGQKKCTKNILIQHHTDKQLVAGILGIAKSSNTIRPAVKVLESKGVISVLKNPNPKFKYDQTRHYEFHPDVVNAWLDNNADKYATDVKSDKCTETGDCVVRNGGKPHSSTIVKTDTSSCQNCHIDVSKLPDIPKIQTEIHKRDDRPVSTPTQSSVVSPSFEFDFKDFNWPDRLKQSQPNLNALKPLPNNAARQEVLDVMQDKFNRGVKISAPTGLLRKLVSNYQAGDFTPVETEIKGDFMDIPVDAKSCVICNGAGKFRFDRKDGTFTEPKKCRHNFKELEYVNRITLPIKEGGEYGYELDLPKVN